MIVLEHTNPPTIYLDYHYPNPTAPLMIVGYYTSNLRLCSVFGFYFDFGNTYYADDDKCSRLSKN